MSWCGVVQSWHTRLQNCEKKCPNFNFHHTSSLADYRKYPLLLLMAIFLSAFSVAQEKYV